MKRNRTIRTALTLAFVIFSCSLVLIPLYFTVLNSFKPYPEIAANIAAFPNNATLANFKEAWKRLHFPLVLFNTLIITCLLYTSRGRMRRSFTGGSLKIYFP